MVRCDVDVEDCRPRIMMMISFQLKLPAIGRPWYAVAYRFNGEPSMTSVTQRGSVLMSGMWRHAIITHADGSCIGRILHLRLSVCLSVFLHDISITDAARITKFDIEMFQDESWKFIYLKVKRSRSRVTKTLPAWVFVLSWELASSSLAIEDSCQLSEGQMNSSWSVEATTDRGE